jgi:hypothetical protein
MENTREEGVARIGLGAKIHPAIKLDGHVFFQCRCPGTKNGWALNATRFLSKTQYPNLTQTCKG